MECGENAAKSEVKQLPDTGAAPVQQGPAPRDEAGPLGRNSESVFLQHLYNFVRGCGFCGIARPWPREVHPRPCLHDLTRLSSREITL